jgi:superfamily II DNA or RNA helicase
MIKLTRQQVIGWFGPLVFAKAQAYVPLVQQLQQHGETITAAVPGTAREPYRVRLTFFPQAAGRYTLTAMCSCPVGSFCKHGAAALLAYIERRPATQINPDVLRWVSDFGVAVRSAKAPAKPAKSPQVLLYLLHDDGEARVSFAKARIGVDGRPGALDDWSNVERAIMNPPKFVNEDDVAILRLLWMQNRGHAYYGYSLAGKNGNDIMQRMLQTGRLYLDQQPLAAPLALGESSRGELVWRLDTAGCVYADLKLDNGAEVLVMPDGSWYVDELAGKAGPVDLPMNADMLSRLLDLPSLTPLDLPVVCDALREALPELPLPDQAAAAVKIIDVAPQPLLQLDSVPVYGVFHYRQYQVVRSSAQQYFDYAVAGFSYDGNLVRYGDKQEYLTQEDGQTVRLKRDAAREKALLQQLEAAGLLPVPPSCVLMPNQQSLPVGTQGLAQESDWPDFVAQQVPRLQAQGWFVNHSERFRHWYQQIDGWHADLQENDNGWFDLGLQIEVAGQRLDLPPLLADLIRREPRWLDDKKLKKIDDAEPVILQLADGSKLIAPAGRIKPLMTTLIDLFDGQPDGELQLSKLDAPRIAEAIGDEWKGDGLEAARQLAQRLKQSGGAKKILPPKGLGLELRPYQREGLAWLQFLREQELNGILADDMGLGKTAQTLAHLLLEKESGRLDQPALIVLPTSLVHNWKNEAARFAPDLRVLALHGPQRKADFERIAEHDVVLTTYPLLWRDIDAIGQQAYHTLILDEAQTVKNAASRSADAVRQIKAQHRLCVTGTPLENHLGELWSLFDFLMPGFLGDSKNFSKLWRTPIEKHGNSGRMALLARRIKPFILRRRKDEVAKELPPKTEIVREVELQGRQRDLYETVRAAMDVVSAQEVASKGFARSQIVILDALLKLRQVCCDPRLVKADSARAVKEHAKLDLLMEMLPELVEEGRRILLFSQFTSMLALIQEALQQVKLDYVLLTGDTTDRETPIKRFQAGEVPIFLISLKAGGVGLNLTAADTVIHFDPWWNPAVENQATDRAHRIGQQKPVFVYKLIVAGSIEDKILQLQQKKADLAAGILSEDHAGSVKFSADDIAALLAPLPA